MVFNKCLKIQMKDHIHIVKALQKENMEIHFKKKDKDQKLQLKNKILVNLNKILSKKLTLKNMIITQNFPWKV